MNDTDNTFLTQPITYNAATSDWIGSNLHSFNNDDLKYSRSTERWFNENNRRIFCIKRMLLSVRFVDCAKQNENVRFSSKIDVQYNYFDAKGYENVRIMNVALVFLCIKVIMYRSGKHRFEYIDNNHSISQTYITVTTQTSFQKIFVFTLIHSWQFAACELNLIHLISVSDICECLFNQH